MTAIARCALSYKTLLELTSTEHHRWRDWFIEHPKAWAVQFATGRMATVGGVVLHIFAVELRYAQRLLDQEGRPGKDSSRLRWRKSSSSAITRVVSWFIF